MLSLLTLFSQGILGCRGRRWKEEGNIRFLFPARNVTTLIIDLRKEQFCSFVISFSVCPFNEDAACLLCAAISACINELPWSTSEVWKAAES